MQFEDFIIVWSDRLKACSVLTARIQKDVDKFQVKKKIPPLPSAQVGEGKSALSRSLAWTVSYAGPFQGHHPGDALVRWHPISVNDRHQIGQLRGLDGVTYQSCHKKFWSAENYSPGPKFWGKLVRADQYYQKILVRVCKNWSGPSIYA